MRVCSYVILHKILLILTWLGTLQQIKKRIIHQNKFKETLRLAFLLPLPIEATKLFLPL